MNRIATILAALVVTLAVASPAQASKRAAWIQPPAPSTWGDIGAIYGSNHDGYMVDNTLYPRRHVVLFEHCPNKATNPRDAFACQSVWSDFYVFLRTTRDGTKQDWIDQHYPHVP